MKTHQQIIQDRKLAFLDPDSVGSGLPLWLPDGIILKKKLENFLRKHLRAWEYQEVETPHIGDINLYQTSGHYPYYADSQFPPIKSKDVDDCDYGWLLKPMNCPHHIKIYEKMVRSYRDLPFKVCEFGKVYRYESSGSLNGLFRARAFTQDDGHAFVAEDHLKTYLDQELLFTQSVLAAFGSILKNVKYKASIRGNSKMKYVGSPELWDRAEAVVKDILDTLNIPYSIGEGEAAFYGPKIDISAEDSMGREWQLGTIQIDFNLPERFNLSFVNKNNVKERPVMVHRAIFGSLERFIAILLESTQGKLPFWLNPRPIAIIPISQEENIPAYANYITGKLFNNNIEYHELTEGTVQQRIAKAHDLGVNEIWIVGNKEAQQNIVSVRVTDENTTQYIKNVEELLQNTIDRVTI